jgi:hypothetical protein
MTSYTLKTPAGSWQERSWRERTSISEAASEPRWVLECNNGTSYIPLVLSSKRYQQDSYQVLRVDGTLCPNVDVRVTTTAKSSRDINFQTRRCSLNAVAGTQSRISYSGGTSLAPAFSEHNPRSTVSRLLLKHNVSPNNQQSILATIPACKPNPAARDAYRSNQPGKGSYPDNKVYCSYWIRHGECDYMQQGCRYKHEMPDLKTLKSIGFQSVPRWYRERINMAAALPTRPQSDFRRMIQAAADDCLSSSESDGAGTYSSDISTDIASLGHHLQAPLVPTPVSMLSSRPTSDMSPSLHTPLYRHTGALNSQESTRKRAGEHRITNRKIPLQSSFLVPNNSPELPAYRQGRFVPAGEMTSAQTTPKHHSTVVPPSSTQTSCFSSLILGSPISGAVESSSVSNTSSSADPDLAPLSMPKFTHYFSPEQEPITAPKPSKSMANAVISSTQTNLVQRATEQTNLEREVEALRARMEVLKQQQEDTGPKQPAQNPVTESLAHKGTMISQRHTTNSDANAGEGKQNAVRQDMSNNGASRAQMQ